MFIQPSNYISLTSKLHYIYYLLIIFWPIICIQACIQYFVWIECALLDGNCYTVSSWFFQWSTRTNKSMMTQCDDVFTYSNNLLLLTYKIDAYRLMLLKFVDMSIKLLDCH